jgi:hypothetical protein
VKVIADSAIGFVGFEGNEQTVGSKIDDPTKLRLTAPIQKTGGGGGVVSFNASKHAGAILEGAEQIEMAMLRVEQDSAVRGDVNNPKAEFNFLLNNGGTEDANMVKVLSFTVDGITCISQGLLDSFRMIVGNRQESPNGRYWMQLQNDGNYVIYDTIDPNHPKPIFDLWWLLQVLAALGHQYPR